MTLQEPISAEDLATELFADYIGRSREESRKLLEAYYKRYVPRTLKGDYSFWLLFAQAVEREDRTFYKPKHPRQEFLYLLEKIEGLITNNQL